MTAHTFFQDSTRPPNPDDAGRPGMIRALATVGLMLALLGLATAPFGFSKVIGDSHSTNLQLKSGESAWLVATAAAGTGLSILLLVASAACMRLLAWGRRVMIVYAILAIVLGAGCGVLYGLWLAHLGPIPQGSGAHGGVVGFIELMGWILGFVYGLWAFYAMTRPFARDAFHHGPPVA